MASRSAQRNPVTIGAIGLVFILVILYASFNAAKLPIIGGGTTYTAMFTEDAGLGPSDDVRIAGIKVGTVSSTSLDGALVKVKFKVKNAFVGNQSTVDIKLKTLLGAKYLAIDSIGTTKQDPHQAIGVDRTTSPFDIYPAFTELTQTVNSIDTDGTGAVVRGAGAGLRGHAERGQAGAHRPVPAVGDDRVAGHAAAHAVVAGERGHRRARLA